VHLENQIASPGTMVWDVSPETRDRRSGFPGGRLRRQPAGTAGADVVEVTGGCETGAAHLLPANCTEAASVGQDARCLAHQRDPSQAGDLPGGSRDGGTETLDFIRDTCSAAA